MTDRPIMISLAGLVNDMSLIENNLDYNFPNNSTNVHNTSKLLFYMKRPDYLEDLCLADFATHYEDSDYNNATNEFIIQYIKQSKLRERYFRYVFIIIF